MVGGLIKQKLVNTTHQALFYCFNDYLDLRVMEKILIIQNKLYKCVISVGVILQVTGKIDEILFQNLKTYLYIFIYV